MFVDDEVVAMFVPGCASELRSSPDRSPSKPPPPLPVLARPMEEVELDGIRGGAWALLAAGGVGLFPERELVL